MLVRIDGEKHIRDATKEEEYKIKSDLTFDNPNYTSAVLYSRFPVRNIAEKLYYYKENDGVISVPRGYRIEFPHCVVEDNRLSFGNIEYPKFNLKLRAVQEEAANKYLDNKGDGIIVLQTGTGKSILGLYLAGKLKESVMIIAHKEDILDGWRKDAKDSFGDIEVGLIQGKKFKFGKQITLAMIQTLRRLSDDKIAEINKNISMVICDENHRIGSKSYTVLNNLKAKYRLGLTATDDRNDGLRSVLDLLNGDVLYRFVEGEVKEILSGEEVKIIVKNSNVKWKNAPEYFYTDTFKYVKDFILEDGTIVKKYSKEWFEICNKLLARGSIKKKVLEIQEAYKKVQSDEEFNEEVVRDIIEEHRRGNPCLVLCKEKEQIRKLDALLHKNKVRDNILYYGDSSQAKSEMKEIAERKQSLITLATLAIATEGTNVKAWARIFLVSSIANKKDVTQAVGRGRRRLEDKKDLIIYDYRHPNVDGINKHGQVRDAVYKNLNFTIDKL